MESFVRVSADRTRLELANGRPFRFAGANCYYLLTRAADPGLRQQCIRVFDDAAAAGLTVLRLWAFADGSSEWNALQTSPGHFDERVFRGLDWLIAEATARGLRLLLVLTNFWPEYGGMPCYVRWAWAQRGQQPPSQEGEAAQFYTDADCQRMFHAALNTIVHRTNTLTGRMYRDEPAILGWSLANEPRCAGDTSCTKVALWAHHTATLLKRLDPHHLVTLDCEGFLGPSTPAACHANPFNCAATGCDFASDCGSPSIDFACCHLYPDHWIPQASPQEQLRFALAWLDCHVELSRQLGKPLVLSEFGKRRSGWPGGAAAAGPEEEPRVEYYRKVLGAALSHMQAGNGLAGWAFWMLAAPSYPDYDGFTLYFSGGADGAGSGSTRTVQVIKEAAAAVAAVNRTTAPATGQGDEQAHHATPLLVPQGPRLSAGDSDRGKAGPESGLCGSCSCM